MAVAIKQQDHPQRRRHRRAAGRQPPRLHALSPPLFDFRGILTGAINMLVDVSDEQCTILADQAERCRRLARGVFGPPGPAQSSPRWRSITTPTARALAVSTAANA